MLISDSSMDLVRYNIFYRKVIVCCKTHLCGKLYKEGIEMQTVSNRNQVEKNIKTLDSYLEKKVDPYFSFAEDLVRKGTCFIAVKNNGVYSFYPSRFIGYIDNTMDEHESNIRKDGRVTNKAISLILGQKPKADIDLEIEYKKFCSRIGFVANEKGCFGVARKYWEMSID